MKKIIIFCLIFLFSNGIIYAQKDTKLSTLKVPSSPAFTILGIQPKDIVRPKDSNSLEVALLNAVSNNSTYTLPNNFSLEVSPYWIKNQNVTFSELENETNLLKVMYRNLSISTATFQRNNLKDTTLKVSQLGFGFRTLLSQGRLVKSSELIDANNRMNSINKAFDLRIKLIETIELYSQKTNIEKISPKILESFFILPFNEIPKDIDSIVKKRLDDINKELDKDRVVKKYFLEINNSSLSIVKNDDDSKITDKLIQIIKSDDKYITDGKSSISKEKDELLNKIAKYREKRVGLIWELAGAFGLESAN